MVSVNRWELLADSSDLATIAPTRLTIRLARTATLIFVGGLLGALSYRVGQYLVEAWRAVNFPFGLDLVEGAIWQQAALLPRPENAMRAGRCSALFVFRMPRWVTTLP